MIFKILTHYDNFEEKFIVIILKKLMYLKNKNIQKRN